MGLRISTRRALLAAATLPLFATPAFAQDIGDDEEDLGSIILTGARISQGGAQDIAHFRSIALEDMQRPELPSLAGFTMEGLLAEHDLTLPERGGCAQLLCIDTHVMVADLPSRPQDTHFIGIGFGSGGDLVAYRSQPLSLIAVVDRSGSMGGLPIARVKEGLHAVIDQLGEGDRFGMVLYGSTTLVAQEVIDVEDNREALHAAIDAIEIDGSTYMEAGLRLGFQTARAELPRSHGRTRMMLFTDENPNVGDTSAEGFIGQAIAGSRDGIGLTTIGVGRHFDASLATQVSSVRGGNLFFVPGEGSATELFEREFANMVTEVAHDLAITIDPGPGYRLSGVFGVPEGLIENAGGGTVTVTIGSAFLSSNGGGIYATLEGDGVRGEPILADVSLAYTDAVTQRRVNDAESVVATRQDAPDNLARAHQLVDQYFGITSALAAYHDGKDAREAAERLSALSERLSASGLSGMESELALIDGLYSNAAQLAGMETSGRTRPWEMFGEWRVVRHRLVSDIARGDIVEITEDGDFITERMSGRGDGETIYQTFAVNEREIYIEGSGLLMRYSVRGDRLVLRNRSHGTEIILERYEEG